MHTIIQILLLPLRFLRFLYLWALSPFHGGDHILVEIPSEFSSSNKSLFMELFSGKDNSPLFVDFLKDLVLISETPEVKKISFIIDKIEFGFAELEEICNFLMKLKEKKIRLAGHATSGDIKTIYLLSFMDERYAFDNAEFHITLPSVETFFFKRILKKWGIEVENYASGKYKSFAEIFTREGFSKEAKENILNLIQSLQSLVQETLKQNASKKLISELSPIQNAKRLLEIGFLNNLIEEEDFRANLMYENYKKPEKEDDKEKVEPDYEELDLSSVRYYYARRNFRFLRKKQKKLAIVPLKGDIVEGEKGSSEVKEGLIAAHPTVALLRKLREDKSIGAVILEIDSGGGSAFGSELIYREILRLKKKRKVYSYFQNISASGGYYISTASEKIISNPFCITGSIGTVMVRPDMKGFYDKLGITKDRVGFYPGREIFSEYGKLSRESKEFLQAEIERVKNLFYNVVCESRKIKLEELEKYAGGRVFSGKDFLTYKMVDSNMGLLDTIAEIKKETEITSPFWEYFPPEYSLQTAVKNFQSLQAFLQNPISQMQKLISRKGLEMKSDLADLIQKAIFK